jgi:DNA damage-binding protein 1
MKSVSILTLTSPSSTTTTSREWSLTEVARHFATLWSSAVTCIGENEWLVADMEGNLVTLRRNTGGVTEDDKRRLEVVSEGRLGEVVNTIVPVHVPSAPPARERAGSTTTTTVANGPAHSLGPVVVPKAFLATVEGGVYMLGSISSSFQDLLMRLQSAVAGRIEAPGYMPWAKYRAFKSEVREADEPYRFVDGELVEMVLGFDDPVVEDVCRELGAGLTVEALRAMVEGLRRLH